MKEQRYWLSFDLGLRGDYEKLYYWLDSLNALECGDGVATFRSSKTREAIAKELKEVLGYETALNARAYLINRKQGGKFILGKRKRAAWAGFVQEESLTEEER